MGHLIDSAYGHRTIIWIRPPERIPVSLTPFKSLCAGCGQEQYTLGGTPLWCDACLKKLRRPINGS